jgi:hypothetical protein
MAKNNENELFNELWQNHSSKNGMEKNNYGKDAAKYLLYRDIANTEHHHQPILYIYTHLYTCS